jgi:hypothetical protein
MSAFIFFQASVTSANAFAEYAKSVPPTLIEYGGSIVTRCPMDPHSPKSAMQSSSNRTSGQQPIATRRYGNALAISKVKV